MRKEFTDVKWNLPCVIIPDDVRILRKQEDDNMMSKHNTQSLGVLSICVCGFSYYHVAS